MWLGCEKSQLEMWFHIFDLVLSGRRKRWFSNNPNLDLEKFPPFLLLSRAHEGATGAFASLICRSTSIVLATMVKKIKTEHEQIHVVTSDLVISLSLAFQCSRLDSKF